MALKQQFYIAAAAAILGYVAYGIWQAGNDPVAPPIHGGPVSFGSGRAQGERVHGHSWSIDYGAITASNDQSVLSITTIKHGIIFQHGKPFVDFTADSATVNSTTQDFTASGAVHVRGLDPAHPRSFDTDLVIWSQAQQKLAFPHPVTIYTRSGQPLKIAALTLDVGTNEIHAERVSGRVAP